MLFETLFHNFTNQKHVVSDKKSNQSKWIVFFSKKKTQFKSKIPKGSWKNTAEYKRRTENWKMHLASQKRGTTSSRRGKGKDVATPAHREGKRAMLKTLGVSTTWLRQQQRGKPCQKEEWGPVQAASDAVKGRQRPKGSKRQRDDNTEKKRKKDRQSKKDSPRKSWDKTCWDWWRKKKPTWSGVNYEIIYFYIFVYFNFIKIKRGEREEEKTYFQLCYLSVDIPFILFIKNVIKNTVLFLWICRVHWGGY